MGVERVVEMEHFWAVVRNSENCYASLLCSPAQT